MIEIGYYWFCLAYYINYTDWYDISILGVIGNILLFLLGVIGSWLITPIQIGVRISDILKNGKYE